MKKIILYIIGLVIIIALFFAWKIFGSATRFDENKKIIYIRTGKTGKELVLQTVKDSGFLKNMGVFEMLASRMKMWQRLKPGKYEIKKGSNIISVIRMFRNGTQSPVNLVITKLRTKKDLAALVARRFECDSAQFYRFITSDTINNFGVDSNTFMTMVIPDTYSYLWTAPPYTIAERLKQYNTKFWTAERKQKAASLGLTPQQVYTLASIVEEETIKHDEKPTIASVYLNRLAKGMNLGADPTIKFAVGDFTIKRILFSHINNTASSPYNTYKNKGLPPGPICTASSISIDAVLNAAKTDYLYFCAKPNGKGYHAFASNDADHLKNAKAYQQWLDSMQIQ
jgi:UPF0755 protein